MDLVLTLRADNTNVTKWWTDSSYRVHTNMKSHTGGIMALSNGAIYGTLQKQKLSTKSSTEAKLVATADVLP